MRARAARLGIPGWALGLVADGKVVTKSANGARGDARGGKVSPKTLFQVGSIAKSVSAIVTVKLLLQKKLRLDDPIKKYLPGRCGGDRCEGITLAHVLNHTSGVVAGATNAAIENGEAYETTISRALRAPRECAPGSCFRYNNAVYELAREIVEKMDPGPYVKILDAELLSPLGLVSTSASFAELTQSGDYVLPHRFSKGRFVRTDPSTVYYPYPGAAGLNSSLEDLLKLVSAELGDSPGVLSPEALKLLHTATVEAPDVYSWLENERARKDVKSSYALGHRVLQYPDLQVVFHTGWVKGCKSVMALFPAQRLGMVLLQNTDSEFGFQAMEDVIALLRAGKK